MVTQGEAQVAPKTGDCKNTKFKFRRPICPYISSTCDFNAERDFLVNKVVPTLDAVCQARGTSFSAVDLRWSANDKYAKEGLVTELCLNKIRLSSPFFICLLGDRYGYHRSEHAPPLPRRNEDLPVDADWIDLNFMTAASGGYNWVLKDGRQLCSLTELEIIEAAFYSEDEHCFFYFRQQEHVDSLYLDLPNSEREEKLQIFQSESEYATLKIRDLKQRIVKRGLSVKYFCSLEDLGNVVTEDWMEVINTLYPPLPRALVERDAEEFHEIVSNEVFAQSRSQNYVCTPELDNLMVETNHFASTAYNDHAVNEELENILNMTKFSYAAKMRKDKPIEIKYKSLLVIAGPRGSGKTALMVNWLKDFTDEYPDLKVISLLVGSSLPSYDVAAFMRRATRELKMEFSSDFTDDDLERTWRAEDVDNIALTTEALMAAASLGPCLLVIDGVDELCSTCGLTQKEIKGMSWLPVPLPPQLKIIMSTSSSDLSCKALTNRPDTDVIRIPLFKERSQRIQLIQEVIVNKYATHLAKRDMKAVVDNKNGERPLYLHVLGGELCMNHVYSLMEHYLEEYLEVNTIRDLWTKIIQRWVADYSWPSDPTPRAETGLTLTQQSPDSEYNGWIADVLRLLAISRHGLTESELHACLCQMGYRGDSKISSLDWGMFRHAAYGMLIERPGCLLNFAHQHCKEAVEYALLGTVVPSGSDSAAKPGVHNSWNTDKQKFHGYLAAFFLSQPHSNRRTDELVYHMELNGDMGGLCSILSDPKIFLSMFAEGNTRRKLDLLHYCHILKECGYNAADIYREMVETRSRGNLTLSSEMLDTMTLEEADISPQRSTSKSKEAPTVVLTRTGSRELSVIEEGGSVEGSNVKSSDHSSDQNGPVSDDAISLQSEAQTFLTEDQEDHGTEQTADPPRHLANLAYNVGLFLSQMDYGDEAVEMLMLAHSTLNKNYPLDLESACLHCQVEEALGNFHSRFYNQPGAIYWYKKSLNTVSDILISSDVDDKLDKITERKGHIMDKLGYHHLKDGHLIEADHLLNGALECMEEVGSVTGRASVQHHMGILKLHQYEYLKAEGCLKFALKIREEWYGKKHTMVSEVLQDLAGLLCLKENTQGYNRDEAEYLFRRALEIREKCLGEVHVFVAETLAGLGELMMMNGSLSAKSEAKLLLQRALDIKTTKLGPDHPSTKAVRKALNETGITLKLGLYDYGPAKPTDKRTTEFPYSNLSWREQDLSSKEGRQSKSSRASKYSSTGSATQSRTPSSTGMWLTSKYHPGLETPLDHATQPGTLDDEEAEEHSYMDVNEQLISMKELSMKDAEALVQSYSYSEDLMKLADWKRQKYSHQDGQMVSEKPRLLKRDSFDIRLQYPDPEDDLSVNTARQNTARSVTPNKEKKVNLVIVPSVSFKSPSSGKSDMPHYVESYADQLSPTFGQSKSSSRTKITSQKSRPKSAPVSSYAEYFTGSKVKIVPRSFLISSPSRPRSVTTRASSAHSVCSSHATYKSYESSAVHGTHCRIPGPHSIDVSNAKTIQGPHSSVLSLMGPPPCPRDAALARHSASWFHVPGRYPTVESPYPTKMSQMMTRASKVKRGKSAPVGGIRKVSTPLHSKSELSVTFKDQGLRHVKSEC